MAAADPLPNRYDLRLTRIARLWPSRWVWRLSLLALIALIVFGVAIWSGRERIAANLIDNALEEAGLEASYDIVSIGAQRQVIANLVVGDRAMPDLTAEQVNVDIAFSYGTPGIGRVELVNPRLYGSYRDGTLSFGALDPVVFGDTQEPSGLPAFDLTIVDGRARIDSDFGVIGAKIEGSGQLDDGFAGTLAATAPGIGTQTCLAQTATLYGALTVTDGEPMFDGPVRLRGVECEGLSLASADIASQLGLSSDLGTLTGDFGIASQQLKYDSYSLQNISGPAQLLWRLTGENPDESGELRLSHDIQGASLATPFADVGDVEVDGNLRLTSNLTRSEWIATLSGQQISLQVDSRAALTNAAQAATGSFAGALLGKFDRAFADALMGGRFVGETTVRSDPQGLRVVIPEARLRSEDGETILALSRVSYGSGIDNSFAQLTGNFITGGKDLPRINGRMEQTGDRNFALRMTMSPYSQGENSLAMPRMELRQRTDGGLSFDGIVVADGALPGGSVSGLILPLEGSWSSGSGLAAGRRCADVTVESLALSALSISSRAIKLCPVNGNAMLRYNDSVKFAAVAEGLQLGGRLGQTPAIIAAKRALIAYPQPFELNGVSAVIGNEGEAVRISAARLDGAFQDAIGGSFSGGLAEMDAIPLDINELTGSWSFADGVLSIGDAAFLLNDRIDPAVSTEPRFEPLYAAGASLTLKDNTIFADADLRHPASGTLVTSVDIRHALADGAGRADIDVPGILFSDAFQPDDLTYLTQGVVADAQGLVTGDGEVTWVGSTVESSGKFRTDGFDFAAEFGPVHGVSGEIVFSDLINLTTEPEQELDIASINTGIEALGGKLIYSLTGGELVTIEDGRWPFMGGTLILRPVQIDYGSPGGQSYIFELIGLDAATFVSQMEIDNIGATGIFDGTIPIFFDENGNGSIRGGLLISRAPGGNVSYVGELTYEDLGTMANYAFESLRSLDYRQMAVELNGSLAGEIITNFQIDGVRQGEGASRNFVTRRLSSLPIRFKINVRSENFYQLTTIVRGMFDPTAFGTPEQRGLQIFEGQRLVPSSPLPPPENPPENPPAGELQRQDESTVQPPESD